ncbi:hypothetical protein [Thorsellia kenyensis]|uniref:Uncharacterized protein n=1 Tax=Thorsellia kenyensis TaxID=1549888 RepID=A0ABV6C8X5_9GAMM
MHIFSKHILLFILVIINYPAFAKDCEDGEIKIGSYRAQCHNGKIVTNSYRQDCISDETLIASCALPRNQNVIICTNQHTQSAYYSFIENGDEKLRLNFDSTNQLIRIKETKTNTTQLKFKYHDNNYTFSIPNEKFKTWSTINIIDSNNVRTELNCHENLFGEKDIVNHAIFDESE